MPPDGRRDSQGSASRSEFGLEQPFEADSLVALRSTVAAHADRLGLGEEAIGDLVLAVHELATNAIRHGGGSGRLRMWLADHCVVCEVSDGGTGFTYLPDGRTYPPLGAPGGRGLWIVAQLGEWFEVHNGPEGTVATVAISFS